MVRVFEGDAGRLNAEISLVRLVEASGVRLVKRGAEQVGHCPFHEDESASLVIAAADNTWRCTGACDTGGGVIDWVMKRSGVSQHHAVQLLQEGAIDEAPAVEVTAAIEPEEPPPERQRRAGWDGRPSIPKTSTVRRLASPVDSAADDQVLLGQVIGYYHETLKQHPEGLAFLQSHGLVHGELIERFRLGLSNRTLGLRLPEKNRKAGAEVRGRLEQIGIYRTSGHEHFNGSLIIPVFDENRRVVQVYGRKVRDDLRAGTPTDLYLPGPTRGVWNLDGLAASHGEVILAGSLIDAMTFWCAGFRNVTAAYGADGDDGFTEDHLAAFKRCETKRVLIAFPRDDDSERLAEALSGRLMAEGFACYRIEFPKGMDANEYALKVTPAAKSLGVLIRKASWLGQGKAKAPTSAPVDLLDVEFEPPPMAPMATMADMPLTTFVPAPPPIPEPTRASPVPVAPPDDPLLVQTEQELVLVLGGRRYRVRGWKKPLNPESLKINLLVQRAEPSADEPGDGRFHVDTFDLYSAKARASFVKQAGIELGEAEESLKHDLGRVLLKVEALQDAEIVQALKRDDRPVLSDAEREEALDLLKAPDLMDRILADFAICGVVGEETNLLVAYLACVSRVTVTLYEIARSGAY
jgi:DNA primase